MKYRYVTKKKQGLLKQMNDLRILGVSLCKWQVLLSQHRQTRHIAAYESGLTRLSQLINRKERSLLRSGVECLLQASGEDESTPLAESLDNNQLYSLRLLRKYFDVLRDFQQESLLLDKYLNEYESQSSL